LRAQGPTEYLLVAAIVLVIALVSISLLGFFPGTASDAQVSQSQTYWVAARPTGVYDAKTTEAVCNGSSRGYTMTLENHEPTLIRLTGISVAGQSSGFCRQGQALASEIRLESGEKVVIETPANISSSAGRSISANISISYTSTYGIARVQYSAVPLVISNSLPPEAAPSAPVANFAGIPTTGNAPLSVTFTDSSTNTPTSWSWTFGDGGTSTAQNPTHIYSGGTYTVSLTATNAGGSNTSTRAGYITASPVCFPAGTIVQTINGATPIEQIKAGDSVYSFDENMTRSISPVIGNYSGFSTSRYQIVAGEFEVGVTSEHPFRTPDGFKKAALLSVGDTIFAYKDGRIFEVQVTSVSQIFESEMVYNLILGGDHTFFANGFAVHNWKKNN
jgi:PKD repeat protein